MKHPPRKEIDSVFEDTIQKGVIAECYKQDLVIQTAESFIYSILMSKGGIQIENENEEAEDEFQKYLKDTFNPLIRQVLRHFLCYGSAAFAISEHKVKGEKPILKVNIVPTKYYTVKIITYSDFTTEYAIEPLSKDMAEINFVTQDGHEPNPQSGELRSMLAPCVQNIKFISRMQELYVDATTQRVHPPVLLVKSDETKNIAAEIALTSTDAEEQLFNIRKHKKAYQITQYAEDVVDNFARMKKIRPDDSEYNDKNHVTNLYGKRKIFYPTVVDNVHQTPMGWEVSGTQPQIPETIVELPMLESSHSEKMLALLRIPIALVLSIQRNRTDITQRIDEGDYIIMQRTIQFWKNAIIKFIDEVYKKMFFYSKEKRDIKFAIPTIPFINSTSLYQLYNQNIINLDTLKTRLIDINNLSPNDIAEKPNYIVRPPPGGSYNDTTMMLEATVDNLKAQSKSVRENIDISQQMADTAEITAKENAKKRKSEESSSKGPVKKQK